MSEFVGTPRLGYKESALNQAAKLGDEFDTIYQEYDSATDMFIEQGASRVRVQWVQNTSGGALVPGQLVKRDTSGSMEHDVTGCGAAEIPCGIVDPTLQSNVADDEKFLMVTHGITDVLCSAAISKGAALGTAASGKAVTNALDTVAKLTYAFGVLIEQATADGQLRKALVDFRTL